MIEIRPLNGHDYDIILSMIRRGRELGFFSPGAPVTRQSFKKYIANGCY